MILAASTFDVGAVCFGAVIGWIVYRTLRRSDAVAISDIATVIGAIGGGAVVGIFDDQYSFGLYAIGLAGGFFAYLILSLIISRSETVNWMGGADVTEHVIVERRVVDNP